MNTDRRNFLKTLAAGSAVGLAIGGLGGLKTGQALSGSPTGQALEGQAQKASPSSTSAAVQPYSYIVFYDSGNGVYSAMNGTTGAIDYSGADAGTIIQQTVNGAPTGGSVYIQVGTYNGTGSVTNSGGLPIIAEGGAVFSGFAMPAFARMPSIVTRHLTLTPNGPFDGGDFGPSSP